MVLLELALVAPKTFLDAVGGLIEGEARILRPALRLQHDAGIEMDQALGPETGALAFKGDMAVEATVEIFLHRLVETCLDLHTKGVAYVERDNVNAEKNGAWAYLPGQRRVRKLPNSCCDVPLPSAAGAITNDEPDVWDGRLDRYDWKLLGKIELYVPYNTNASLRASIDDLIGKTHLNPDHVRWELHRVWVVEGNLAAGKRHAMVKSRYYLDEDTWMALLGDRWAESGALAKTLWTLPLWLPAIPAVAAATSGSYDLATGTWVVMAAPIGRTEPYKVMPSFNDAHFTPDALTAEGVR